MMSKKGIIEVEITCKLDTNDCKPWDELTPEQKEQQRGTNPGCSGTGEFGGLCVGCHFCLDWEIIDTYLIEEEDVPPPLGATDTLTVKAGRNNEVVTRGR